MTLFLRLIITASLIFRPGILATPGLYILSPTTGQVVQGIVEVKGSIPSHDFSYAELSYSFEGNQNANWFLITRIDQSIQDGLFAFWDTTTITDGAYRLKLAVTQKSGNISEVIVERIQVGNYTHYDAPVLTLEQPGQNIEPESTPTKADNYEPTEPPENPASINQSDIILSTVSGLILTVLIMGILGVYTFFRRLSRK
ncbi:MAG: hypothetical protein FD147_238 [Chloroflexi bacterium]|nr:MAG: hypothetical protein FD147_238 [Chloroflexota bacterium]